MKIPSSELTFKLPLWAHQKEEVDSFWQRLEHAHLWSVGTGKSPTLIANLRAIYYAHQQVLRTLILAPNSTLYKWENEFIKHAGDATLKHLIVLAGPIAKRIVDMQGKRILITNYEFLDNAKAIEALVAFKPVIVASDEMHLLRNHKSKRFKKLLPISDKADYRRGLTGTPIANSLMDVWAQYRFLDKGKRFHTNFYTFRRQYFVDKNLGMPKKAKYFPDWQPIPGADELIKKKMFEIATVKTKAECLDLPPIVRKQIPVELSKEQQKAYDEMKRDYITYVQSSACVAQIALTKVIRMLQITSGFVQTVDEKTIPFDATPRLEALTEQLDSLIHHNKVIVWSVFRQNYALIAAVCKKLGTVPVFLTGDESASEKEDAMQAFEKQDSTRVIIANPQAGGTGVDLIASSVAIYYSRNYSFIQREQSEGRNHRGGSQIHDKITYIDIIARGTIEEDVLEAVEKKENLSDKILDIAKRLR